MFCRARHCENPHKRLFGDCRREIRYVIGECCGISVSSEFVFDKDAIRARLDGVPINEGPVLKWIGEYVKQGTSGEMAIS